MHVNAEVLLYSVEHLSKTVCIGLRSCSANLCTFTLKKDTLCIGYALLSSISAYPETLVR